jgi:hypothetical protein
MVNRSQKGNAVSGVPSTSREDLAVLHKVPAFPQEVPRVKVYANTPPTIGGRCLATPYKAFLRSVAACSFLHLTVTVKAWDLEI